AVFPVRLRGRHLVVAVEHQIFILDGEQRVGAPLRLVGDTAARLAASSPLIREQELGAIIVERRRVPEGHVCVGRHVDAEGMGGVVNIEQQTKTGACPARYTDLRIYRDVVALIRAGWRPRRGIASATFTGSLRRAGGTAGGCGRFARGLIDRGALFIARRYGQVV